MKIVGLLIATLVLALSASASHAQVRSSDIVLTPPDNWVTSVWRGPPLETGEFTPKGQTGGAYVDLVGFSAFKTERAFSPAEIKDSLAGSAVAGCRRTLRQEASGPKPDWASDRILCVGRPGQPNKDLIEVNVRTSGFHVDTVYSVWRAWRGSQTELADLLKDKGGQEFPAKGEVSDAQAKAALEVLATAFAPDIARFELCDLRAPEPCAAYSASAPPALQSQLATAAAKGEVMAAIYADGTHAIGREEYLKLVSPMLAPGATAPDVLAVQLTATEFATMPPGNVGQLLRLVQLGGTAKGGAMIIYHPTGSPPFECS